MAEGGHVVPVEEARHYSKKQLVSLMNDVRHTTTTHTLFISLRTRFPPSGRCGRAGLHRYTDGKLVAI